MTAVNVQRLCLVVVAVALIVSCSGYQTKQRISLEEFRTEKSVAIASAASGAQANQNCLNSTYIYHYQISSGVNVGEVWLCCIPIDELLRDSFRCNGVDLPVRSGSGADQKVQTCRLLNPTSTGLQYTVACIPAPP
jgi:hypothetical protein